MSRIKPAILAQKGSKEAGRWAHEHGRDGRQMIAICSLSVKAEDDDDDDDDDVACTG